MKVYFLKLTQDDFTNDSNVWTSPVIDLYNNDYYKNYSTTKSKYGLNSLGNRTWTGLSQNGSITDSGEIVGGRFIDTTGKISIYSWDVISDGLGGSDAVYPTLSVYGIDDSSLDFPDEWSSTTGIPHGQSVTGGNFYRYGKFVLEFDSTQSLVGLEFTFLLRIQIEVPVIAPLYKKTQDILYKFPEWMSMRDLDLVDAAIPELATPQSLGGKLLNAVAGEWLTDIDDDINYARIQQYINTADENQVAWIYKSSGIGNYWTDVIGDGTDLAATASLSEFYELVADEDGFWVDENEQAIFTNKLYTTFTIGGTVFTQERQAIWNWFDEHGAIVDLYRHPGESNSVFRQRILDVYKNRPGVSLDAFKLALRRELNLWYAFSGATPDSLALGATPEVLEMTDIEASTEFNDPDGMPKQKFIDLVEELAELYPTTWGYFKWDRARWDMGGLENEGYGTLPYRYDATPLDDTDTQSGVGDGNDLFVYRPDVITGPREFNARLKLRGRQRGQRLEYPPLVFGVELYGTADREIYDNPEVDTWVTVEVTDSSDTYYASKLLITKSDVDVNNPTPTQNSWETFTFFDDALPVQDQTWYDSSGNAYNGDGATPFYINSLNIQSVDVKWGRFDPDLLVYTDFPVDNEAKLWFSDDPGTTLLSNGVETSISAAVPTDPPNIVVESQETSSSIERWESERQERIIEINGALPDNGIEDLVIDTPTILWDNYLESPPNKKYVVKFTTLDSTGTDYVAEATMPNGDKVEYPIDMIEVNNDSTWSSGVLEFNESTTSELTFSSNTNTSPDYPVYNDIWILFEAEQNSTTYGVVDENGPWRNGVPQGPGNTNFVFQYMNVDRDDFDVPNNEDHVITWMGIEIVDNGRVIAWLDTNTVNPATATGETLTYPDNAIVESLDGSVYVFSPFVMRVRLRPGIDPEWNPQIHSGWFYDANKEHYLYANPKLEVATATPNFILSQVARQGAPIILKTDEATPIEYRQVAFIDDATPQLVLENKEIVNGSEINKLYVAYADIFNISIIDLGTDLAVSCDSATLTNEIPTATTTSTTSLYEVTYTVNRSFIANHEFIDENNENKTKISVIQDGAPVAYTVTYEGSTYDPATPVDLPLNSFYTTIDEGFIFIGYDEYDPVVVEVRLSPSKLVADGEDYLILSVRVLDLYGNPKPNQVFQLDTTFGTFDGSTTTVLTTDRDGFATAILDADNSTVTNVGYVYVDGPNDVDATVSYSIDQQAVRPYRLVALPSADQIPADGEGTMVVYGKVEDPNHQPVPYATVAWKRDRSICSTFATSYGGQVIADDQGVFSIGPFTAATPDEPGYWFVAAESWHQGASPSGDVATPDYDATPYASPQYGPIGDVVFWNEYADSRFGVNDANELPKQPIQMQTNSWDNVYYSEQVGFPVTYDDATPLDDATPVTVTCTTPQWYAIDRYTQYQLGFLGTGFYSVDFDPNSHPDYNEL